MKIIGTGSYVPERIVTNDDIAKLVDTNDEWIVQRVGIKERRICVNETACDMAIKSAERALESAGVTADELDFIICSTISTDIICPTIAAMVQKAVGAVCPCFDMNSACSGFLFALDMADALLKRGGMRNILVIGSERMSKIVDWSDRSTCVIFGDGAGAAVVTNGDNYLASRLYTKGGDEVLHIPSQENNSPFFEREIPKTAVYMNGQETFSFAVKRLTEDVRAAADDAGISIEDIDFVVPHQANIRIIGFASKRLGIPIDKFVVDIEKYGNTSSASSAIALDELARSGRLKRGDIIAMCAFGGGLSSAVNIIRW